MNAEQIMQLTGHLRELINRKVKAHDHGEQNHNEAAAAIQRAGNIENGGCGLSGI